MKTTVRSHVELERHLDRIVTSISFNKHPWDIIVEKHDTGLSAGQRNLYWDWVKDIGNHFGYFKDEMHEIIKDMHMMPTEYKDLDGRTKQLRPSITKLKVKEMREYMDRVRLWAGTEGIYLKDPSDLQAR